MALHKHPPERWGVECRIVYRKLESESEAAAQARAVVERERGGARRGGPGRDEGYGGEAERGRGGDRCGDGERRRRKEAVQPAAATAAVTPGRGGDDGLTKTTRLERNIF